MGLEFGIDFSSTRACEQATCEGDWGKGGSAWGGKMIGLGEKTDERSQPTLRRLAVTLAALCCSGVRCDEQT